MEAAKHEQVQFNAAARDPAVDVAFAAACLSSSSASPSRSPAAPRSRPRSSSARCPTTTGPPTRSRSTSRSQTLDVPVGAQHRPHERSANGPTSSGLRPEVPRQRQRRSSPSSRRPARPTRIPPRRSLSRSRTCSWRAASARARSTIRIYRAGAARKHRAGAHRLRQRLGQDRALRSMARPDRRYRARTATTSTSAAPRQQNLAAIVANPLDLLYPRGMTPADAARRAVVLRELPQRRGLPERLFEAGRAADIAQGVGN